jgi:hypothetical protein
MAYSVPPSSEPSVALFSSSIPKNLSGGGTTLGFDTNASYNSPVVVNTYDGVSNTSTFTIGASGLYSLEVNVSVAANGATWSVPLRTLSVLLSRGGTLVTMAAATVNISSGVNYTVHSSSVFPFLVGDTLQMTLTGAISTGTPTVLGVANTFDLNTWVTFQYIKSV